MEKRKPIAYIAGFECFYEDGQERAQRAVDLCQKYGVEAISPVLGQDGKVVDFSKGKREAARQIYEYNMGYLDACDMIIANLNTFRGNEPDSGTCVECGIAIAKGKKCFAFVEDARPMVQSFKGETVTDKNGVLRDLEGANIEDFDMPLNLMIGIPFTIVQGDIEQALIEVKKQFNL